MHHHSFLWWYTEIEFLLCLCRYAVGSKRSRGAAELFRCTPVNNQRVGASPPPSRLQEFNLEQKPTPLSFVSHAAVRATHATAA